MSVFRVFLLSLAFCCCMAQAFNEKEQYTCPPCACIKDGEIFEEAGVCGDCHMRLVTMKEYHKMIENGMTAVLIFDGMELLDMAGPWEVLSKQRGLKLFTVSVDGKPINSMGLKMVPDYSLADAPAFTYLVVPGGDTDETAEDERVKQWLKANAEQCEQILSICTGSFILAEAGLLDGKEATTFHTALDDLAERYPKVTVRPELRYVDNGQIITSAGISAGTDAAFYMVSKLFGLAQAKTTALGIEYDWNPDPDYVRARFADMIMPRVSIPDGLRYRWLENDGDVKQWTRTALLSQVTDQKAVVDTVSESLKAGGWQAVGEPVAAKGDEWQDGSQTFWQGKDGVKGVFRYKALDDQQMKISVSLQRP